MTTPTMWILAGGVLVVVLLVMITVVAVRGRPSRASVDRPAPVQRRGGRVEALPHSEYVAGWASGFETVPAAEPVGEQVECSVFSPATAPAGSTFMVQVALHVKEASAAAEARALQADPTAGARANKSLTLLLERGDEIELRLTSDDEAIEIVDRVSTLIWNGDIPMQEFLVRVPSGHAREAAYFSLLLLLRGQPVAAAKFRVGIGTSAAEAPMETKLSRYRNVFISYSSKDRGEVLRHYQLLHNLGLTTFLDVMTIRAGERWEPEIYEALGKADLVLLYWSENSAASKWVVREAELALQRRKESGGKTPDILPIVIQTPPPHPPESLTDLHFNDPIRYIIYAHEQTQAASRAP